MTRLILYATLGFAAWLIKRDCDRREGVSAAIWIPTLWLGIIASRPLSAWLGFGGGSGETYSIEGSPADRLFFLVMIVAALVVLSRRQLSWSSVISTNWAVFLFYGFLLVSVLWGESAVVCFKRWFKEFGNILVVLVILTEVNPQQAFRAVFVRCSYLLIPLSLVYIRYFPELGRRYNTHSGEMEAIGVTFQKNSLGALVLVCGLILFWDWLENNSDPDSDRKDWVQRYVPLGILLVGAHLLHVCDSKTSMACLALGALVISAKKLPLLRWRIRAMGVYLLVAAFGLFLIDWTFGIKEEVVGGMGRDMTFTGRTDVWRELLALDTDPIIGTGYLSFWSDMSYHSKLPNWVAFSAHNGYLEVYLDGGMMGIFFLVLMLIAVALKVNSQLAYDGDYGLARLAILLVVVVANFSESQFVRMSPVGFLFLAAALDVPWRHNILETDDADVKGEYPEASSSGQSAETAPIRFAV